MASDSTRDRLLRAAAAEVARHGIKGASMRGVAERADIRAASIFHYFPGGKDALIQAMLQHIMETIANRMTPTIHAGSDMPPIELIVQCSALLWDFMGENPEYAGALMREALQPDDALLDVVTTNASQVVELAIAYIEAAQAEGQLSSVPARRMLLRIATFVMTLHAAPSIRHVILGADADLVDERAAFLRMVRADLTPA